MKIFKTKSKHVVLVNREFKETYVYLKISKTVNDENGVIPYGYYYTIINDEFYKLDDIHTQLVPWDVINGLETQLSQFQSNSLYNAIHQRVEEFTFLQLQKEGTTNYGIDPSDWELYEEVESSETEETPTIDE